MEDSDTTNDKLQELIDEKERRKNKELRDLRGYKDNLLAIVWGVAAFAFVFIIAMSILTLVQNSKIDNNQDHIESLENRLEQVVLEKETMRENMDNCVIYIADNEIINVDEISHNCPFDIKRIK